jgi:UDP-N-acetylglucosamine--N-acetylmuramyl-(pentapeptide) pyrophosphoryl-undecaprenol N-acetylglucosamine transferase
MSAALAAADVAVSRAGASSLAELAARQLPSVLIPYPTAADDHQYFNAGALARSGAASVLQQETATPGQLADDILELLRNSTKHSAMRQALAGWHRPMAAAQMADRILHWDTEAAETGAVTELKLKAENVGELHC